MQSYNLLLLFLKTLLMQKTDFHHLTGRQAWIIKNNVTPSGFWYLVIIFSIVMPSLRDFLSLKGWYYYSNPVQYLLVKPRRGDIIFALISAIVVSIDQRCIEKDIMLIKKKCFFVKVFKGYSLLVNRHNNGEEGIEDWCGIPTTAKGVTNLIH